MDMKRPLHEKDCPKCGEPMRWKNIEEPRCESCDGVSVQPVARTVIDRLREYAGKDRNQVVNPNITAREAIQIADYLVLMERAAHRWEALLNCARIRPLGSAGLSGTSHDPNGVEWGNRAHLGLELWTVHSPVGDLLPDERRVGVEWLTKFADKAILANKERD